MAPSANSEPNRGASSADDAVTRERLRFANYLHDGPCQSVSVLANLAYLIAATTGVKERGQLVDRLAQSIELLASDLRSLVRRLRANPGQDDPVTGGDRNTASGW